jgi:uncharacterized protein YodC (DUF2158 family)
MKKKKASSEFPTLGCGLFIFLLLLGVVGFNSIPEPTPSLFEIGDVVQLKSGGSPYVITNVRRYAFTNDKEYYVYRQGWVGIEEKWFNERILKKYEKK